MSNWNKISLGKFQQIDAINSRNDIPDIDKVLFSTCAFFDLTEYELDNTDLRKADKMIRKVSGIFSSPFNPEPYDKIGKYILNYDPGTMRFGQFMELDFFLQDFVKHSHKSIASITNEKGKPNDSENHEKKSKYFLKQPVTKIIGSLKKFAENFGAFKKKHSSLFGLDEDPEAEKVQADKFNKTYGWWYAAEAIAGYKKISLEQAYDLNIRDVFSSLAYLKAKNKYETEQLKKK